MLGVLVPQQLDRHRPVQHQVDGTPYLAHAARRDPIVQPVPAGEHIRSLGQRHSTTPYPRVGELTGAAEVWPGELAPDARLAACGALAAGWFPGPCRAGTKARLAAASYPEQGMASPTLGRSGKPPSAKDGYSWLACSSLVLSVRCSRSTRRIASSRRGRKSVGWPRCGTGWRPPP